MLKLTDKKRKRFESIAESYIDVSVYSINNRRLADALVAAHVRGVKIRVLTDRLQASGRTSRVMELRRAGIPVRIRTGAGVMHTKVAIYDGISVSSGSLNWTEAAVNKNDEVCDIFTNRPDYAAQHQRLFNERWDNASHNKSEEWFAKKENKE